jgi:hypothetical protein
MGAGGTPLMLTVAELVDDVGLSLLAGEASAAAPIRWVHASELADPTPWLSGGELILTTGMQLGDEESQRRIVDRLVSHHAAGPRRPCACSPAASSAPPACCRPSAA